MAILLIRHGETMGNRDRVLQTPETPLSDRGLVQASKLAKRLEGEEIGQILSSDFARAHMTANAISTLKGLVVHFEPLLQERSFGDLRGLRYADLKEDPFGPEYTPPGGESWDDFYIRADRAWERIQETAQKVTGHLVVVTHGLVLHSIASRRLELPEAAVPGGSEEAGLPLQFRNTALTVVDSSPPWKVRVLGCAAHLDVEDEAIDGAGGISGL